MKLVRLLFPPLHVGSSISLLEATLGHFSKSFFQNLCNLSLHISADSDLVLRFLRLMWVFASCAMASYISTQVEAKSCDSFISALWRLLVMSLIVVLGFFFTAVTIFCHQLLLFSLADPLCVCCSAVLLAMPSVCADATDFPWWSNPFSHSSMYLPITENAVFPARVVI